MIVVKNMEMPSDCMECMFCNHLKINDYGSYGDCAILGDRERMNLLLHQKHSDCPLVEIITCKDCKHCDFDNSDQTFFCNAYGNLICPSHFCAESEVRNE